MDLKNIMKYQPTINIGLIGSVSNGKSSITEKLTGTKTQRYSTEIETNKTIKIGYANLKIFRCPVCKPPVCFQNKPSNTMEAACKICGINMELVRHISLVDIPGHNLLMATMLNGTCVMGSTILVESAANKIIPNQTVEHLMASKIINLKNNFVLINKSDLISKPELFDRIKSFKSNPIIKDSICAGSPIIPVAANYGINMDIICEYIYKLAEEPLLNIDLNQINNSKNFKMYIIRSFNINQQDSDINLLEGAVLGGTIIHGILKIGDQIMIYPGIINKNSDNPDNIIWNYKPLVSRIVSINSESNSMDFAIPGGLIGIKTTLDPAIGAKDGLVGNLVLNSPGNYKIFEKIYIFINYIVPGREEAFKLNNILTLNVNAYNVKSEIIQLDKKKSTEYIYRAELLLDRPICVEKFQYITLSKINKININTSGIEIIGRAKIMEGIEAVKL